jgi:hypothetical protein
MIIRHITLEQLQQAADAAGVRLVGPHTEHRPRKEGRGFRCRLGLIGEQYRRLGHTGRRVNAVCWHGHYAFMAALFALAPDAVIITASARYDGSGAFNREVGRYDGGRAYNQNIGSQFRPLTYGDACTCGEED